MITKFYDFINEEFNNSYFGKFLDIPIYLYDEHFIWSGDKYNLHIKSDIRKVDIINYILTKNKEVKIDNYKDFIDWILKNILYEAQTYNKGGIDNISCQEFELKNKDDKSLLNYINTNIKTKNYLKNLFKIDDENSREFFKKIWDNRFDLFTINGKYFNDILNILNGTINKGNKIEEYIKYNLLDFFRDLYKDQSIILNNPTLTEDFSGIDLIINGNNLTKTIQIKNLSNRKILQKSKEEFINYISSIKNEWEKTDNETILNDINNNNLNEYRIIQIESSSSIKKYNTDFICFTDLINKKVIIFKNKDVIYDINKHLYIVFNTTVKTTKRGEFDIIYLDKN